jgi:hypothetical protein
MGRKLTATRDLAGRFPALITNQAISCTASIGSKIKGLLLSCSIFGHLYKALEWKNCIISSWVLRFSLCSFGGKMIDYGNVPDFDSLPPVEGMDQGCAWGLL